MNSEDTNGWSIANNKNCKKIKKLSGTITMMKMVMMAKQGKVVRLARWGGAPRDTLPPT